jgi:Rrf2 family protein
MTAQEIPGGEELASPRRRRPSDPMFHVSAKLDYAVRAVARLAAADPSRLVKSDEIAQAELIPLRFLLNILTELRHARIVRSHRGSDGGYQLARDPADITVADVVRAVGGGLNGLRDEGSETEGALDVWTDARQAVTAIMEGVTLADIAPARDPSPAVLGV